MESKTECNSPEDKHVNFIYTREFFDKKYSFLAELIDDPRLFDHIFEIMQYYDIDRYRKRYIKSIDYNLTHLGLVLAIWQLFLYEKQEYIGDTILKTVNDYLLSIKTFTRKKAYISTKFLQTTEYYILKDLYADHFGLKKHYFSSFPKNAFLSYKKSLTMFQDYIPKDWPPLNKLDPMTTTRPRFTPEVFVWVSRKEVNKYLLSTFAKEFGLDLVPYILEQLKKIIDTLYVNYYTSSVGDIVALTYILFKEYKKIDVEDIENIFLYPKSFLMRLRVYEKKYTQIIQYLLDQHGLPPITI